MERGKCTRDAMQFHSLVSQLKVKFCFSDDLLLFNL